MGLSLQRPSDLISLSPKRIFQAADAFLYFARDLVDLAFVLELRITCHFAGRFLHSTFGLLGYAP
jgi:hypothetical protein